MRKKIQQQFPIVYPFIDHEHAEELQKMSDLLDRMPRVGDLVFEDLTADVAEIDNGRPGLSGDQVLRLLVLKQMNGFSYDELAFHMADSRSYRSFCRFGIDEKAPSRSTLQANIKRIRPETIERINHMLLGLARADGIENGRKIRIDSTVTESNIHHPTDSSLLYDCVRILARLLVRNREWVDVPVTDHTRRAKRRAIAIRSAKSNRQRKPLYRDLLKVTGKTVHLAERMAQAVGKSDEGLAHELQHYIDLTHRVIDQTERRVLLGESVPAAEKVVSIFEAHTDVIVKDRRDTYFGHKIFLTSGRSGLFLDCVVEEGNPADTSLAKEMVERQENLYGRLPRQVAFDGGFASKANLKEIQGRGVQDVAFSKKCGLKVSDMAKSTWVYKQLRDFRAGIEGMISFVKRCFGLGRCLWRGEQSFRSYVWGSVLSVNLMILARRAMT